MAGNRKAEATARQPASRTVDLVEALEDTGKITGRNPRACVPYGDLHPVVFQAGRHDHLSSTRELKGIVDDVLQRLVRLRPVAERRQTIGRRRGTQNQLASRRPPLVPIDERPDQVIHRERGSFDRDLRRVERGELIRAAS